jgi:plastocyanin
MNRTRLALSFALFVGVGVLMIGGSYLGAQSQPAPRTLTVLVGAGQDTTVLDAYFPTTLRIRAGDTLVWKFNGDEPHHRHTVTFTGGKFPGPFVVASGGGPGEVVPTRNVLVPGGPAGQRMFNPVALWPTRPAGAPVETYDGGTYVNSGHMLKRPLAPGVPAVETFSLTFTKPGTYRYYCVFHPHMQGVVEVLPATATDVMGQADLDRMAEAETKHLLAVFEKAKGVKRTARQDPGPGDTSVWYVRAGSFDLSGEMRAQPFEYLPKNVTVKAGDTVVWESVDVHTITFNPTPLAPELHIARPQADGRPQVIQNPKVYTPAKPTGFYDPTQYYNSSTLGVTAPIGTSWSLSFDKPGVYEYFCALHHQMGMKGTVTVVPR